MTTPIPADARLTAATTAVTADPDRVVGAVPVHRIYGYQEALSRAAAQTHVDPWNAAAYLTGQLMCASAITDHAFPGGWLPTFRSAFNPQVLACFEPDTNGYAQVLMCHNLVEWIANGGDTPPIPGYDECVACSGSGEVADRECRDCSGQGHHL